jgi:hypothetical protein
MNRVSRPLQAVLVAVVLFLAVWLVALRPSASPSGSASPAVSAPGVAGLGRAVNKAHQAVANSNAASLAHGGTIATTPSISTFSTSPSHATPAPGAVVAGRPAVVAPRAQAGAAVQRLDVVSRALQSKKVLALLFYNPAAADDVAVRQELASIPLRSGRVVELAVPLTELTRYPVVSTQVAVNTSPTLVVINSHQLATTIVGFADSFEISQRIADALQA